MNDIILQINNIMYNLTQKSRFKDKISLFGSDSDVSYIRIYIRYGLHLNNITYNELKTNILEYIKNIGHQKFGENFKNIYQIDTFEEYKKHQKFIDNTTN